jgi:hypothetical protein
MEVIPGSVHEQGNGNLPPKGGAGKPEKKARRKGADKEPVVGRKDSDGQEGEINVTELKKVMPKAIKLEKDMIDKRSDASAAYKRWAEETGTNAAQLRKAAKAYANEKVEAERRKAAQLALIFTEVGA